MPQTIAQTLAEMMFHAQRFCSKVEDAVKDAAPISHEEDVRIKIGQCRNQFVHLQKLFEDDKLNIENPRVRAEFRQRVMAFLWISFLRTKRDRFQNFPHAYHDRIQLYLSFGHSIRVLAYV